MILFSMLSKGYTPWTAVELFVFVPNILIFYITGKIKPLRQEQLLIGIFFAAGIICVYAIYQYFFGLRHTMEYLSRLEHSSYVEKLLRDKRVFATFISPNIFASYVVMMLFVGIGLLRSSQAKGKIIYWIGITAMGLALLYTKSLGGLIVFAVTVLIFIRYSFLRFSLNKVTVLWLGLGIISITAILFLLYRFLLCERLTQFFDLHNPNNSIIQRFYYWKASINVIKDFPLTGIGWRRFGVLYDLYKPSAANTSHFSHNVFLQIFVETGPLGLASFVLLVGAFLRNGITAIRKAGTESRNLKIGLFCAGCAFLIHNRIDLSFYFGQVAFFSG